MAKIQLKRLTSTDIDQALVVLAVGEPCLAKDTDGKQYIVFGDGVTALKDLKREPIGDAASVAIDDLTIVENTDSKLEVQLSDDAKNSLTVKTDGLFVETFDQVKVSTKTALPTTGKEDTLYVVSDEKHIYYWDGAKYVQLTQDMAGMVYRGAVDKTADLPTTGLKNGDFYWIVDEDLFKIYNGTTWDTINLPQGTQGDMADTVSTSLSFIKNKKAEYLTFVPLTGGVLTKTNVQEALEEVDAALKKKQDKVPTAKENNYASWDKAGQTKDSGDSKTTTLAPYDTASDDKLPSEKAVAKKIQELEELMDSQPTSNAADQGDKAILPLMTSATNWYVAQQASADGTTFADNLIGGYVFTSPQGQYLNKMFNRIKLMIATPGWVRVGIVRGTGTNEYDGVARGVFAAGPKYDRKDAYPKSLVDNADDTTADGTQHTALKKWLVVQWVATPGLHEFDIPDTTITSPLEYLFIECRQGESGWALNRNSAAATMNGLTIPANTTVNATTWPTSYLSKTNFNNGSYAVSNNMLDASARPFYSGGEGSNGVVYAIWNDVNSNSTVAQAVGRSQSTSWLNLGIYQRGSAGNTYLDPIVENCITQSVLREYTTNCIAGYGPDYDYQQTLAENGSEIYGVEIVACTPGDLTFYVFSSNDPATAKIVKCFTLRVRSIGRQLIHLPEPVVLQPGQWCGLQGATEAAVKNKPTAAQAVDGTKFKTGYADTCKFAHAIPAVTNWDQFGDDPEAINNLLPYSSAVNGYSKAEFTMWQNVKYVAGATAGEGKFDFTGATLATGKTYLNIALVVRGGSRSKLEDMNYSVTGDSISTYNGQISRTNDFGVKTNAAGNNAVFYPNAGSGLTNSIDGTWWGILGKQTRMRLVKNDAWSGSRVSGTDSTTSSTACASDIRAAMLSCTTPTVTPNTTAGLGTPYGLPDIIFCMIGTNDLSGNVAAGAWSNTAQANISTIIGAFETMVVRHKQKYPSAKLVYFLIPRGNQAPYPYTNGNALSIAQLADSFEYAAKNLGAYFVPINYFSSLNRSNASLWTITAGYSGPRVQRYSDISTDLLHPSTLGHQQIADALQRFCEEKF